MDALTRHDLEILQGAWKQVAMEENGLVDPPDSHGAPDALTWIDGHTFSVRRAGGEILLEGRFELDARARPKRITWIDAIGPERGLHLPAVYELNARHFVFIAADAGMPRPSQFRTGPGQTLRRFERWEP